MPRLPILLASSSHYRHQLLQKLGIQFDWAAPNIDETPIDDELPAQLVCRLAEAKAKKASELYPSHLIIGSDQVAILNHKIIGKPHTHEIATAQLTGFSGQEITFLTGLCLLNSSTNNSQVSLESYKVKFKQLSSEQIQGYLKKETPYDCAGSFKAEGLGISLFEGMSGDDPNTLIGLPLIRLTEMLIKEGVDPLTYR